MKCAYIKNSVAVDVVQVDPAGIFQPAYAELFVEVPDEVKSGWTLDEKGKWSPPPPPAPVVPPSITPLQGLLAIDAAGLSAAYETWADDPARTFAERAFITKAQTWRRNDPILQGATTALGLTAAQLDGLFILAATL